MRRSALHVAAPTLAVIALLWTSVAWAAPAHSVPTVQAIRVRQALVTAQRNLGLISSDGLARSLQAKLARASAALERGSKEAAGGAFDAFSSEVGAQTGKQITSAAATALLTGQAEGTSEFLQGTAGSMLAVLGGTVTSVQLPSGSDITSLTASPLPSLSPVQPGQLTLAGIEVTATGASQGSQLPDGTSAAVTMTFTPSRLAGLSTVRMWTVAAGGTLEGLGTTVVANPDGTWTVTGHTTHFSPFWVTAATPTISTLTSGLGRPMGVATAGRSAYVTDWGAIPQVFRIDLDTGGSTILPADLDSAYGIAADTDGTIYVSEPYGADGDQPGSVHVLRDGQDARITTCEPSTSTTPATSPGGDPCNHSTPVGLALDRTSDVLYIADWGNGRVLRHDITTGTTTATTFPTTPPSSNDAPYGLAWDPTTSTLLVSSADGALRRWTPGTTTVAPALASGDTSEAALLAVDATTGYAVAPRLVQGARVDLLAPDGTASALAGTGQASDGTCTAPTGPPTRLPSTPSKGRPSTRPPARCT